MDAAEIAKQLPVLLGAGAGAAAKGAASGAGKAAFEALRDRLKGKRPQEGDRLDRVLAELSDVSASLAELAGEDEEIRQAVEDLAASVQVSLAAGSQVLNYGSIERSVAARDINTLNM